MFRAAWWEGFYERMVGLMKRSLKKSIGKNLLWMEELVTIITEVEAVVNSRPITYTYSDIEEGSPLTPAHFLCGKRLIDIPDTIIDEDEFIDPDFNPSLDKEEMSNHFKMRDSRMKSFWSCWRKEYLLNLREHDQVHRKRTKTRTIPKVGDIVLLGDQMPRSRWKLAKIIKLISGKDGVIRAVDIKTSNGNVLQRAIQHLYPLEVHGNQENGNNKNKAATSSDVRDINDLQNNGERYSNSRPQREAAVKARRRIRSISA